MSDAPTDRNRLPDEASPYLRQHAENPVNWQPWDEKALAAARERDVPIFLSVGYSACHWCHVMEEESFEDERVAELLNGEFVPIKVDREERPDLDGIYQTISQLVTGRGGWPLSVWLTPDGRPFYVGTYFPTEPRRGMPGFLDLLENVSSSWETDRDEIESRADQWTRAIADRLEETPEQPGEPPGSTVLTDTADAALRTADREHGGFGRSGPKFPQVPRLDVLLRAHHRTGRDAYREVVHETLSAMANRGLYDHVGGGFHRYATDREWTVPHFEKMLYDNAELPRIFLAGYQATGEERFANVARETFTFVERELTAPDGGFYSTLDARSGGEEGTFYVWTPKGVHDAIGDDELARLVRERYGIAKAGNFDGASVLTVSTPVSDLASEFDIDESEVHERLDEARSRLFDAREDRDRPGRDEKVLAGWNGLMVSALAEGGLVLDERYAGLAAHALGFVREHLWNEERNHLRRRYKDGEVRIGGYLEDYAFLSRGAFDLYQSTGEVDHLSFALKLGRTIRDEFFDADAGTLYFTSEMGEELVARPQEPFDQSTPSSLGVAADVLLSLSHFAPDEGFDEIVERVLETHSSTIASSPLEHATLALVADRFDTGAIELTVVADELPEMWRERFAETYLPGRILARRPPDDDELSTWLKVLSLDEVPPIWADRTQSDERPTIYSCRSFTCSPPVTDVDEAIVWAENVSPDS